MTWAAIGHRRAQTGNRDFISPFKQAGSGHRHLRIAAADTLDGRVAAKLGFHRGDGLARGGLSRESRG